MKYIPGNHAKSCKWCPLTGIQGDSIDSSRRGKWGNLENQLRVSSPKNKVLSSDWVLALCIVWATQSWGPASPEQKPVSSHLASNISRRRLLLPPTLEKPESSEYQPSGKWELKWDSVPCISFILGGKEEWGWGLKMNSNTQITLHHPSGKTYLWKQTLDTSYLEHSMILLNNSSLFL